MKKIIAYLFFLIGMCSLAYGKMGDIGNVKLNYEYYPNTTTSFKGTFVFLNGSGTDLGEWKVNKPFFKKIKKMGSVFLYDRSGLGKSPFSQKLSNKRPLTAELGANQLFELLERYNIPKPYILIAHSYGAMYAGYFTLTYSPLVKCLILIDPVPRKFQYSPKLVNDDQEAIKFAKNHSSYQVFQKYPQNYDAIYQLIGFEETKKSLAKLGEIKATIPVMILSSTQMEYQEKPILSDWYETQKQWLNSNKKSGIFQVNSGHFIQFKNPKPINDAISKCINEPGY